MSDVLERIKRRNSSNTVTETFFRQLEYNVPVRMLPLVVELRKRFENTLIIIEKHYGFGKVLLYLHSKTGIPIVTWAFVFLGGAAVVLQMIFRNRKSAMLLANGLGLFYPLYKSSQLLVYKTNNILEHRKKTMQWISYWSIYSGLNYLDHFSKKLVDYIPLYYIFKTGFLVWCFHPSTEGARQLGEKYLAHHDIGEQADNFQEFHDATESTNQTLDEATQVLRLVKNLSTFKSTSMNSLTAE
jgi:hypothetical protein